MLRIESMRHPAFILRREGNAHSIVLAVALLGVALAAGPLTIGLELATREASEPVRSQAAPELELGSTTRYLTVAHWAPVVPVRAHVATAKPEGLAGDEAPVELDWNAPPAEAVRAHALLGALLSLEADGDTTETSEGLELIAAPAAVAVALADATSYALRAEAWELLPRMGSQPAPVAIAGF